MYHCVQYLSVFGKQNFWYSTKISNISSNFLTLSCHKCYVNEWMLDENKVRQSLNKGYMCRKNLLT